MTGTKLTWVDTVLGDLATKNSANLSDAIVVIAKGCLLANDGGGGVFYWEVVTGGDNGGTIIEPTGATGGGGRWVRVYSGPLDVRWFGARAAGPLHAGCPDLTHPDPDPDNSIPIQKAIAAANAAGGGTVYFPPGTYATTQRSLLANVILTGAGPTQSILKRKNCVNEAILSADAAHGCGLRDLGFYGNNENHGGGDYNFQPVRFSGCNNVQIDNIRIHRGTDASSGVFGLAAGLTIVGGSGHRLHRIEVTGDGLGDGIYLDGASRFELVDPYVHDMAYSAAEVPADDLIEGIRLMNCTEFALDRPRVRDLGGRIGPDRALNPRRSRAIPMGGNSHFSIHSPHIARVDQGLDVTGNGNNQNGGGNLRFEVTGGVATDCYSWGYKFANCARDGTVTGCVAVRCGMAGFVASPPSALDLFVATSDLTFIGCTAYDCGGTNSTTAGFRVLNNPNLSPGTTRGVRFIGCRAIARQTPATMLFGFHSEVAPDVAANLDGRYNECVDCVSFGHTSAAFENMHESRCEVWLSANQQISSSASSWTQVNWNADSDLGAMHDTTSNNSNIITRRAGTYRFDFGVEFQANANGVRGLRILENGGGIRGATVIMNATTSSVTALNLSFSRQCSAGTTYRLEVFQDSNSPLDLTTASGGVVEQVT